MHSVLHDWPDEQCRKILENLAPAMKRGFSKLLINEIVISDTGGILGVHLYRHLYDVPRSFPGAYSHPVAGVAGVYRIQDYQHLD